MKSILFSFVVCLFISFSFAQPAASTVVELQAALEQLEAHSENSLVKNIEFTNIGPTVMSGRVVDLDVNPLDPTEFYVAYASGGLWHTNNNGTSFTPVMDNAPTQNLGDIAVDWKNGTLWVGTGENNSSRSSYAGIGILKSTDKGKTWKNMGLEDSHHIGRIILNPNNPDEVVIAVAGHLYSPNEMRGVYKTMNGGKTWNKTLFVNNETGIIDLEADPNNFNIQYATSWQRDRKAWHFEGSGEGSAIYKSTDAGNSWTNVSMEGSGFPTGNGLGRIGLAVYDANTVYAFHDNQDFRPKDKDSQAEGILTKEDFRTMTIAQFLELDNSSLNRFLRENNFQEKYRAENVKQMVSGGTVKPEDLAKYLEDANAMLFDTPVIGAEIYKTTDGGKSWTKTHDDFLDDIYYSYGYYFGEIRVERNNPDAIYIFGVPILKSKDGGKSFKSMDAPNVHVDHHALWLNPNKPGHLINGNDGGVNITYDDGENWLKANSTPVMQVYALQVDNQKPYNVYAGSQDNGVWVGPNTYSHSMRWHNTGDYPYKELMGGDGMYIEVDERNPTIVYTGFQFGNYFRIDRDQDKTTYIQPKHELGEAPFRFNWQTPILLSKHNQDILYYGGNKLMRSMNQGGDYTAISPDLTKGGKKGNVAYGTLTSIDESPFQFGLLYAGSDDGLLHITHNGGGNWEKISDSFPLDLWVSRVIASQHKKERVYVTLNGYRWDDFKPYVYMSEDYGQTWKAINGNLPLSPVNVIREDPANANILYLGTDNGAYVTFNRGENWERFSSNLPNVAVHDLRIQAEAKDLVLGTHGRSIYKTNIAMLQEMSPEKLKENLIVFDISNVRHSERWGSRWNSWREHIEPSTEIRFYTGNTGAATIMIKTEKGTTLYSSSEDVIIGFNSYEYDLTLSENGRKAYLKENKEATIEEKQNGKYYLPKGIYNVEITLNGVKKTKEMVVE
ncbi:glycosyl hydrolase [uncultured Planktosalinus sp.]|uniref:VPS10 domain-containing protein n=1 Tax=uncultured Planktosalinus sp. TaxID=1810935 RepID=UPI0030D7699B